jgi:mercuric ion transport protein
MIKERGISMKNKTFTTGVIGTLVTILCCATPILNILLGSVGLASINQIAKMTLVVLLIR